MKDDRLKVAICGIRGIPACYGGFETFAEELASRLVLLSHDVTVYGRAHVIIDAPKVYKGIKIRLLPAPKHKYLETPLHSLLCFVDIVRRREIDVVLVCNAANSPFVWILRLFGYPVAVNVDGIERKRAKWNWLGRIWYFLGELSSVLFASRIIADAQVIRRYYQDTYKADSTVIAYGFRDSSTDAVKKKIAGASFEHPQESGKVFEDLGITKGNYLLYVSRLEPENNAHLVIQAYNRLPESLRVRPLVIVGDAPYARDYIIRLKQDAGPGVIFAGYRFGNDYEVLQLGAYLYIQATEVGGTHPALVEAMGFGNCILANGTPENMEVLGDAGICFAKNDSCDLTAKLQSLLVDETAVKDYRRRAFERASEEYSWARVADEYEKLFKSLAFRT